MLWLLFGSLLLDPTGPQVLNRPRMARIYDSHPRRDLRASAGARTFRAAARAIVPASTCLLLALGGLACRSVPPPPKETVMPTRPIADVQRDHTDELMSVPGVVGVYEGALDDGTPCLRVMVKERTPETDRRIPRMLEGYRVEVEVSGVIRPLGGESH